MPSFQAKSVPVVGASVDLLVCAVVQNKDGDEGQDETGIS